MTLTWKNCALLKRCKKIAVLNTLCCMDLSYLISIRGSILHSFPNYRWHGNLPFQNQWLHTSNIAISLIAHEQQVFSWEQLLQKYSTWLLGHCKCISNGHTYLDFPGSKGQVMMGVEISFDAVIRISRSLGIPSVTFISPRPAKWKVLSLKQKSNWLKHVSIHCSLKRRDEKGLICSNIEW